MAEIVTLLTLSALTFAVDFRWGFAVSIFGIAIAINLVYRFLLGNSQLVSGLVAVLIAATCSGIATLAYALISFNHSWPILALPMGFAFGMFLASFAIAPICLIPCKQKYVYLGEKNPAADRVVASVVTYIGGQGGA